jgi:hypothetical protein
MAARRRREWPEEAGSERTSKNIRRMAKRKESLQTSPMGEPAWFSRVSAPFGPTFFVRHLTDFVRKQCPRPGKSRPIVQIHLMSGEVLYLCNVIDVSKRWVALGVYDDEDEEDTHALRTEIVPYNNLVRITVKAPEDRSGQIGFFQQIPPTLHLTPESTLPAAQENPPGSPQDRGA